MRPLEALVHWVTQIIMFVILAAVIDLLTPQTAMKKYIKLVVGLLLILVLLKPIFALFQLDMEGALTESFLELSKETETEENIESLIDFQKKEIESTQHAYILEQMAVQLKEIAEVPMEEEFDLAISHIEFAFSDEQEISAETLNEVIVYVNEKEREGDIAEIEEVVIDTGSERSRAVSKEQKAIQDLLTDLWELEEQQVTVVKEGGTS